MEPIIDGTNRGKLKERREGNKSSKSSKIKINSHSVKGEKAKLEDISSLSLQPSDVERVYICDSDNEKKLVMIHYVDGYDKISVHDFGSIESQYKSLLVLEDSGSDSGETERKVIKKSWGDIADQVGKKFEEMKKRISPIRGWIINDKTKTVVCRGFSETSIVHISPSDVQYYLDNGYTLNPFIEGTIIRIFWYQDQWVHSTNKKINFINSRIPVVEASIFDMFKEALPGFDYGQLNKERIYIFHLMHKYNQIMNQDVVETPKIYHLATLMASTTDKPMELVEKPEELYGVEYIRNITVDEAEELLQTRRCIIARKGFELIQLASVSLEKSMRIRSYNENPFNPIQLLYMKLPVEDRPYLIEVVPPHQKQTASQESMDDYIRENSDKLSSFCAEVLLSKISGSGLQIGKTVNWLVKKVKLDNPHVPFSTVKSLFDDVIYKMVNEDGETLYRCFKEQNNFQKHSTKKGSVIIIYEHHPDEFNPSKQTVLAMEDFPVVGGTQPKREKIRREGKGEGNKQTRKPVSPPPKSSSNSPSPRSPSPKKTNPRRSPNYQKTTAKSSSIPQDKPGKTPNMVDDFLAKLNGK